MKLKGKLLTTYLIPILVVGILGLVAMLWSGHYFMAMIQNDNVKVQAALEIEINDTEAIKDIMNYLTYRTPDLLEQYKKNTSELKFFLAQYKNRGLDEKEVEYIAVFEKYLDEFEINANNLINIQQQQIIERKKIKELSKKITELFLSKIQEQLSRTNNIKSINKQKYISQINLNQHELTSIMRSYLLDNDQQDKENIKQKIEVAEKKIDIETKDELGELAYSFKKLQQNIHNLAKISKSLGEGNFDTEVIPRSEKDLLAYSLLEMKQSLQKLDV